MNSKQFSAIISPAIILMVMYPTFQFLSKTFMDNWRFARIIDLMLCWLIWGLAFPLHMIGMKNIKKIIKPQKSNFFIISLVILPLIMTITFKNLAGGTIYEKTNLLTTLLLIFSVFGNGFFEELLWRVVYM